MTPDIGHTARAAGVTRAVADLLANGALGSPLEMRARGKEDRRAGGEDLIVLGTHTFDLMRQLAGDPRWVFSSISERGRELRPSMMRQATEAVGAVGGDDIAAVFSFNSGVHGYFSSRANDVATGRRFGVTVYCSRGFLFVPLGNVPSEAAWMLRGTAWVPEGGEQWERVDYPPGTRLTTRPDTNHVMALDLVDAVEKGRAPVCGARDGRWAIEMVEGIYQSQWAGARIAFPLVKRS